jgi:hypothetical protein
MVIKARVRRCGSSTQPCSRALRLGSCIVFLAIAPCLWPDRTQPAEQSHTEFQIKAAYLFNFLKFVEWPGEAYTDPQGRWVIGVLGESPVGSELILLTEGKTVVGRGLLVKQLHPKDNLRECHILFVSASEEKHLASVLSAVEGSSVLTVADFDKFIQRGGMIQFVTDGDRIRMEIDQGATGRARLKVSSKLLALAQAVTATTGSANN